MVLKLLIALVFIALHGIGILYLLGYDLKDAFKRPFLIFCFATGGNAFLIFLIGLSGFSITPVPVVTGLVVLIAVCGLRFWITKGKGAGWKLFNGPLADRNRTMSRGEKALCIFLLLIILTQLVCAAATAIVLPESSWDGRARWAFKANILYTEQSLHIDYFQNSLYAKSHPCYPLLIPLELVQIYQFLGDNDDSVVKILFVLYLVMLLWAFYDTARRFVALPHALLFTAFLATLPLFYMNEHPMEGLSVREGSVNTCMADIPMAFYAFMAAVFFLHSLGQRGWRIAVPTSLILFFCSFTKSEGIYYSIVFMISYALAWILSRKGGLIRLLGYCLVHLGLFLAFAAPWLIFKAKFIPFAHQNFPEPLTMAHFASRIHRAPDILLKIASESIAYTRWHIVWIVFIVALLIMTIRRRFEKNGWFLLCATAGFFSFYVLVYMLSSWWGDPADETALRLIDFSLSRLLFVVVPLVILYGALGSYRRVNNFE